MPFKKKKVMCPDYALLIRSRHKTAPQAECPRSVRRNNKGKASAWRHHREADASQGILHSLPGNHPGSRGVQQQPKQQESTGVASVWSVLCFSRPSTRTATTGSAIAEDTSKIARVDILEISHAWEERYRSQKPKYGAKRILKDAAILWQRSTRSQKTTRLVYLGNTDRKGCSCKKIQAIRNRILVSRLDSATSDRDFFVG